MKKECLNCGSEVPTRNKLFCCKGCMEAFSCFQGKSKNKLSSLSGLKKSKPRNYEIKVKFTKDEKEIIKKKSDDVGIKMSEFARCVCLNSTIDANIPEIVIL